MKTTLATIGLVLLAGCATPQPEAPRILTEYEAGQMSVAALCIGVSTFRPVNAQTAQRELGRRGVNCADHSMAIQQEHQMRAQALGAILSQPAPAAQPIYIPPVQYPIPAPRPQVNCTSQWVMGQYRTTCR